MVLKKIRIWLKGPVHKEWPVLLGTAVFFIVAAWLFFDIAEDMVLEDPFARPDTFVYAALQSLRYPTLDAWMVAITELGDTWVVAGLAVCVSVWLVYKRAFHTLLYWVMAIGGGSAINSAIKIALKRARPGDMHYDGVSVFSFPSGHSTTNALLYGFLVLIVAREMSMARRIPIIFGLLVLIGLIAFSRLYLGAHWLSDVAGGLAFGSAWLALLGLFYMWRPHEPVEVGKLLLVACMALVVFGGVNITLNHRTDMMRYAFRPLTPAPVTGLLQ